MWETLRSILLYGMLYDTVSLSNSLSYNMSYDSIKHYPSSDWSNFTKISHICKFLVV